jgi:hypothetical protein
LYQRTINIQQNYLIQHLIVWLGAYSGAVGWGTALQAGRLRVWYLMVLPEFFVDIILLAALWSKGLTQPLSEMSNRNIS